MNACVYLASLDGFDLDDRGQFNVSHSPPPLTPDWDDADRTLYWEIVRKVPDEWAGRQTDWGCWVAVVTKERALELYDAYCPATGEKARELFKPEAGRIVTPDAILAKNREIRKMIEALPSEGAYGLVARES